MKAFTVARVAEFAILLVLYPLVVLVFGLANGEPLGELGADVVLLPFAFAFFTGADWVRQEIVFGFLAVQAGWSYAGFRLKRGLKFVLAGQTVSLILHFTAFELRPFSLRAGWMRHPWRGSPGRRPS